MVLIFAEVHPFGSVTAEPIAVDIVSPEEAAPAPKKEEPPKAEPSEAVDLPATSAPASSPASAAPPQASPVPQKQAALSTPRPNRQQVAAQPAPPPKSPLPAYTPPEPDLTVKYQVMLGLPPALPQGSPQDRPGDGFDAPASKTADIASSVVTEFRRHLRTCSKLPESIVASDKLRITLRVFMTPEARLAVDPILTEASASEKGPALMQGAIAALKACQPYQMLPVDRYGEWKELDLSFTPEDFAGAS
jgi:hypothetical protein